MARFLFVVLPLTGHLNATLAVGQAVAAAGAEVAWCGPETDLLPLVEPTAAVYPTGKRYYRQDDSTGEAAARSLWDGYLMPFNRFILEPVAAAIADFGPDVVVVDQYAVAGALAAHRQAIRWTTLCTGAMELTPPSWELPGHQDWLRERLARVWGWAGLAPDPALDLRFSPYLVLALTSTALVGQALLPARCVLVGPALGRRPDDPEFPWADWDPECQHLLVTMGTSSEHMALDFYPRLLAALAPLAERVQPVLVASPAAVPDPPGQLLVLDRVPMLELLPRLDAVLCHGGMGTVTEALAFGVPLVVAPIRHDQPALARQVAEAGAGISIDFEKATAAEITEALVAVLDEPAYRTAAGRIADSFAAAGGAARAAELLAELAAGP
ncbi:MAG: glycosyltransferase [Jatrophihabitantaceae bacterium]